MWRPRFFTAGQNEAPPQSSFLHESSKCASGESGHMTTISPPSRATEPQPVTAYFRLVERGVWSICGADAPYGGPHRIRMNRRLKAVLDALRRNGVEIARTRAGSAKCRSYRFSAWFAGGCLSVQTGNCPSSKKQGAIYGVRALNRVIRLLDLKVTQEIIREWGLQELATNYFRLLAPGVWSIRGAGAMYGGANDVPMNAKLEVILETLHAAAIDVSETSVGGFAHCSSYEFSASFNDGGLSVKTGNYWFGERGGKVSGTMALQRLIRLMDLRVSSKTRQVWSLPEIDETLTAAR